MLHCEFKVCYIFLQVAENLPPRPPPTPLDAAVGDAAEACRTSWRWWSTEEHDKAIDDAKEGKRPDPMRGRAGIWAGWLSGTYARCEHRPPGNVEACGSTCDAAMAPFEGDLQAAVYMDQQQNNTFLCDNTIHSALQTTHGH